MSETFQLMGGNFVLELMDDAAADNCPIKVSKDWKTIADWINYSDGELSSDQRKKISNAWGAYLAIGVAPSIKLQEIFNNMADTFYNERYSRPPIEVMNVFDRLLATDEEIQKKRTADIQTDQMRLDSILKPAITDKRTRWRKLNPITRKWIFVSFVWITIVLVYAYLFDPFDAGGWDGMDSDEINRLVAVASLPFLGGLIYRAYRQWVV